jgi:2,4-didehydro-3-deoxy-L-rhamnonate hydrolase
VFRLVNIAGRAALERDGGYHDLAIVSGEAALGDPMTAIARSAELHAFDATCEGRPPEGTLDAAILDPPVPSPRQIFGIGLNYRDHAGETGAQLPPAPLTFTKFATSITGPTGDVPLSGTMVDWEVEIVAVIGRSASHVSVTDAWNHVAGLTLGQDISDRAVQMTGVPPQFSLGKSFAGYSPIGPALVSVDTFDDRDDIELWCDVNGHRKQHARSSRLIFSIPTLVAYLSSICTLLPGDLIFTGTPSGVGMASGTFLAEGDVIESGANGIGSLRNRCVSGRPALAL